MSLQTIEQNFTAEQTAAIKVFEASFRRVTTDQHLQDWLDMIPGLRAMSDAAKAYTNTSERAGRSYNQMFAALLLEHGRSNRVRKDEIARLKPSFSYLLWLSDRADRLDVLAAELDKLPFARRVRITSPISAYKLVKAVEDAAAAVPTPEEIAAEELRRLERPQMAEKEFMAELRRHKVGSIAAFLAAEDPLRAKDFADKLLIELKALKMDGKRLNALKLERRRQIAAQSVLH